MEGKKQWYIVDGYRPSPQPDPNAAYEGHESIVILSTDDWVVQVLMCVHFAIQSNSLTIHDACGIICCVLCITAKGSVVYE